MRFALLFAALFFVADAPRIETLDDDPRRVLVTVDIAKPVEPGVLSQQQGEAWLTFARINDKNIPGPPMLGRYEVRDRRLTFAPAFLLEPGQLYRAASGPSFKTVADYRVPELKPAPPVHVVKVVPANAVLPANVLKFYVYFSGPIEGGEKLFDLIRLVDSDGKTIIDPWLRDEIWDADSNVLIIYIHPGRIKWGVSLRDEFGPVLVPDRDYKLIVSGDLLDSRGRKLGKEFVVPFKTSAEDRVRIELRNWKLSVPEAGTRRPLEMAFPTAIDHKSLGRFLKVNGMPGKIEAAADGKNWTLFPDAAWEKKEYRLEVDGRLEDIAGNNPVRPFDVDRKTDPPPAQDLFIRFTPGGR